MSESNGRLALANRIGTWTAIIGLAAYVFWMCTWVGAADEKFKDAETVESKQTAILLQQATIATKQQHIETKLIKIEEQMKEDKEDILDAIKEAHED